MKIHSMVICKALVQIFKGCILILSYYELSLASYNDAVVVNNMKKGQIGLCVIRISMKGYTIGYTVGQNRQQRTVFKTDGERCPIVYS